MTAVAGQISNWEVSVMGLRNLTRNNSYKYSNVLEAEASVEPV